MLLYPEEASQVLARGRPAAVAGDEALLRQLPAGPWIGGTIPYFMGASGGEVSQRKLFVRPLPCPADAVSIRSYDVSELDHMVTDAPENGFSIVILPAGSDVHSAYARNAPGLPEMFMKPVVGWVSGVHLDDLNTVKPRVMDGQSGQLLEDRAVVLHAKLPPDQIANVGIVNVFSPGSGAEIRFPATGFSAERCQIDGKEQNFAEYVRTQNIDTRLPLVADYFGAMVNVSIQTVDTSNGKVDFYAPVFDDMAYHFANPIDDYVEGFTSALPRLQNDVVFSCNCILNFVHSELNGRRIAGGTGPMTFGEIAYQLLNQTMVYLTVEAA